MQLDLPAWRVVLRGFAAEEEEYMRIMRMFPNTKFADKLVAIDEVVAQESVDHRPTGPDAWDLIQMAQADEQMAAYLALNPDPITGLIPRSPDERLPTRPLPERDHPDYRDPYGYEPGQGDYFLYELYGWEW